MVDGVETIAQDPVSSPIQKALAINLDPLKYGTIVEIGAGQEVARWFFQAGAAAGTIAKTMSAYDMKFSDEIYGETSDRRYVSRARLERMLQQEFDLVVERIADHRPEGSRFFAFANTVAAQGFRRRDECHGWIGVRLQMEPRAEPDEIILHVRMLDDTNIEQQEALGILGVNLIHGAFEHATDPKNLLRRLMDNLKWGRVEIDLVEFRGPTLGGIDNRLMSLELVKASLTRAVLFDPDGSISIPAEELHRNSVLAMRGAFYPLRDADTAIFEDARGKFLSRPDVEEGSVLYLAELTMAELANDEEIDTANFLGRVNALSAAGFHVMISEFFRYFRVRQYFARYSNLPVGFVTDARGFADIFHETYYDGIRGGILEGLGQTFPVPTVAYVYPGEEGGRRVRLDDLPVADDLCPLLDFLRKRGQVVAVDEFGPGA